MRRMSVSKAWEDSRRILAGDGRLLIAVALGLLVLPGVVSGVVLPPAGSEPSVAARILSLVAAFIGIIGQLALVRLAIGPSTTVGQSIAHGARRFPATLGALILLMVAIALFLIPIMMVLIAAGLIEMPTAGVQPSPSFGLAVLVLVIASLLVAVKFMLSVPIASAEDIGSFAILKRSWQMTKGNYWGLLGLEVLLLIAALALLLSAEAVGGVIAQAIGGDVAPFTVAALILSLFTALAQAAFTVLATVMLARIYVQLARDPGQPVVSVPSSGT